jgi:hypothetical protein
MVEVGVKAGLRKCTGRRWCVDGMIIKKKEKKEISYIEKPLNRIGSNVGI